MQPYSFAFVGECKIAGAAPNSLLSRERQENEREEGRHELANVRTFAYTGCTGPGTALGQHKNAKPWIVRRKERERSVNMSPFVRASTVDQVRSKHGYSHGSGRTGNTERAL